MYAVIYLHKSLPNGFKLETLSESLILEPTTNT